MKTISELQTGTRFHMAEGAVTLTETTNLEVVNQVYRALAAMLPWSEIRRSDTSTVTTAGTANYDWPDDLVFLDVTALEIQNGDDQNFYRQIFPPPDEWELANARRRRTQAVPDYYVRFATAVVNRFELAPAPKYGGKIVRITGIIEPPLLEGTNSQTLFLQRTADDALEHMIASTFYYRDGFPQAGEIEMNKALTIFQQLFGKERVPVELLKGLVVRKE